MYIKKGIKTLAVVMAVVLGIGGSAVASISTGIIKAEAKSFAYSIVDGRYLYNGNYYNTKDEAIAAFYTDVSVEENYIIVDESQVVEKCREYVDSLAYGGREPLRLLYSGSSETIEEVKRVINMDKAYYNSYHSWAYYIGNIESGGGIGSWHSLILNPENNEQLYIAPEHYEETMNKANGIADSFNFGSSYDKVRRVYNYLCKNIAYDNTHTYGSMYNALIEGTSVCAGYAASFQYMMERMGIECYILAGNIDGEAHAWNAVRVDGQLYQIDPTWGATKGKGTVYQEGLYFLFGTDIRNNITKGELVLAETWHDDEPREASKIEGGTISFTGSEAYDAYIERTFGESAENTTPESDDKNVGWASEGGFDYWYENGVKQGLEGRGKEIFDPSSNAWYWLDAVDGGRKAVSKDLYQESEAGLWGDRQEADGKTYGKWVRYDSAGHMIKGWDNNANGKYYFDMIYGTMAKGFCTIDGIEYYFDTTTGVLQYEVGVVPESNGWRHDADGKDYWYENGIRQGYSVDPTYRGKEIYDPGSDAWYWLDNIQGGAKAVSKDVYQESLAGDWGETVGTDGQKYGKWVRYDKDGHMVKGWNYIGISVYYFDKTYGTMAKGNAEIDGKVYTFDMGDGKLKW